MKKRRILQYGGSIVLALAIFFAGAFSQGLFHETDTAEFFGTLSDCFLFPAVFLGGIGALSWIGAMGNFDMLSYGFSTVIQSLLHPTRVRESFYEYKVRREEEKNGWLKHFLVIGLVCLGCSFLFLFLYLELQET